MLTIRCFAPTLGLALNNQPIPLTEQPALLLAYLISHGGQPCLRANISRVIWPQSSAAQQSAQLRNALRALKNNLKAEDVNLEDLVRASGPGGLAFVAHSLVQVDALQLERAANNPSANLNELESAAALYTGEFLGFIKDRKTGRLGADNRPDNEPSEIDEDLDAWWARMHQHYQNCFDGVLSRLITQHAQREDFAAVAQWGEQWARLGQITEPGYCELMTAHHALDDAAALQRTYDRAVADYPQSLSIPRSYHALQKPQIRHNLPAPGPHFVGRANELAALTAHLVNPAVRLMTVYGLGGMGKSALALQAAHLARQSLFRSFVDGVFWVALEGCDTTDAFAQQVARAISPQAGQGMRSNPRQHLVDLLREKRALLVLDDVDALLANDDVAEGALPTDSLRALLLEIYHKAQTVTLLITTRVQLNLSLETPLVLDGLSYPSQHESIDLSQHSSAQLFQTAAAQHMGNKFKPDAQQEAVAEICRQTEGLPLALRLAAAQLPARAGDCAALSQAIAACYRVLQSSARDLPSRHRSVFAVFETSWQLLSAECQGALARLALFQGGLSRSAAQAVAQANDAVLSELLRYALLQVDEASNRFSLHALLRQFCAEKLAGLPAEAVREAQHAFTQHFLALAQAGTASKSAQSTQITQAMAHEWANAVQALHLAHAAQDWPTLRALAQALGEPWNTAGRYSDARSVLPLACQAAEALQDTHALVGFLAQWGRACVRQADYAEAEGHFARGRALAERPLDVQHIALIDYERAQLAIEQSDEVQANEWLDECIEIGEELNDWVLLGEAYRQKARVYYNSLRPEQAHDLAEKSYEYHQRHSDVALLVPILRLRADVAATLANKRQDKAALAGSESLLLKAFEICSQTDNARENALLHYAYAQLLRVLNRWDEAEREAKKSLHLLRQIGDRKSITHVITLQGYCALDQENYPQAITSLESAIRFLSEQGDETPLIALNKRLAQAYVKTDERANAIRALQSALAISTKKSHPLTSAIQNDLLELAQ
jgi:predicted ATPase/DNA-binding SARP family transcriptional activator